MKRIALAYAVAGLLSCSPTYQSGSTECSTTGECPTGFICGGASSSGAADVCYSQIEAACGTGDVYYCPGTGTCWSSQVACSTVIDCGNGNASACVTEGYIADCSSSSKCQPPVAGGGYGGSGGGASGGSGGGYGGSAGSTGTACNPSSTATACTLCIDQSCCPQLSACDGQASCVSLSSCISACSTSDTTCMNNCETIYSSAVANLSSLLACGESYCSTSCNTP